MENFADHHRRLVPMTWDWARVTFENKVWGAGESDDRRRWRSASGGAAIEQLSPNEHLLVGNCVRFSSAKKERFILARVGNGHLQKGQ